MSYEPGKITDTIMLSLWYLNYELSLIETNVSAHNKLMRAIRDNNNIKGALEVFQNSTKSILYELS
jgi:hypothetical protein